MKQLAINRHENIVGKGEIAGHFRIMFSKAFHLLVVKTSDSLAKG